MRKPLPDVAYFVFLSRAFRRPLTEIWPIRIDRALQRAFTTVYNVCRYDLILDYNEPPEVAVPAKARAWLRKTLERHLAG
jgi:hypothetical protein